MQLRGDTDGGSVWSTTIVNYQRFPPSNEDDGQYCIGKAVFAPTHPDPNSRYWIKFVDGDWRVSMAKLMSPLVAR